MKLEDYCIEKGYGISEINVIGRNFDGYAVVTKKEIAEAIGKNKKDVEGRITEKNILENGEKKIVFSKDWNELCMGSAFFLGNDFYIAIDGHLDFTEYGIWTAQDNYYCGDYRNYVLNWCADNKKTMLLVNTHDCHEHQTYYIDFYKPKIKGKCVEEGNSLIKHKNDSEQKGFELLKKAIKDKKGVLCLDYDILSMSETQKYNLDKRYSKVYGITLEKLKRIMKEIMDTAKITTLFVDIPYKRKDILEKILE